MEDGIGLSQLWIEMRNAEPGSRLGTKHVRIGTFDNDSYLAKNGSSATAQFEAARLSVDINGMKPADYGPHFGLARHDNVCQTLGMGFGIVLGTGARPN